MKRNRNAIFRPRGFTLVEIMIATLVFSVGMMAVISMEFSALRAYTSGRDLTVATDLGYRTISLMRTEASDRYFLLSVDFPFLSFLFWKVPSERKPGLRHEEASAHE